MTDKDVQKVMDEGFDKMFFCDTCQGYISEIAQQTCCREHEVRLIRIYSDENVKEAIIRMKQLCGKNMLKDHNNEQVRLGQIILGKDEEISSLKAEIEKLKKRV